MDENTSMEAISVPNLELAQHQSVLVNGPDELKLDAQQRLDQAITQRSLTGLYKQTCAKLNILPNPDQLAKMEAENARVISELDDKLARAKEELGELEQNNAKIEKAEYYAEICEFEQASACYNEVFNSSSVTLNQKLDITFGLLQLGFFSMNVSLVSKQFETAKQLVDKGGDWERRNRLKAYECIWWASQRDFDKASQLFLDCLSTFASPELMPFSEFVKIGCVSAALSLNRADLKKKVTAAPEVIEALSLIESEPEPTPTTNPTATAESKSGSTSTSTAAASASAATQAASQLTTGPSNTYISDLLSSLYDCQYSKLFYTLPKLEQQFLKPNRYLYKHRNFYIREMKIKAYSQLLQSYRSLTLTSMANSFGVTEEFIDRDLSKYIASGRLHCVIDKVAKIVETNRPDNKNAQFQSVIKKGDLLLNRIQKLSRVINI
ncbi:26S proteasome non-ATPase regulatory subunit 6 [Zancudomyces culisetae]|uniref:26S proteasome non-ATPase regulatory subunit 6 n=1 Tax=Zancudomyces culisetae TaxID=1213189 RepID=A0A1R1PZI5_ZANCU|nr:26S proteasome non-ATPase regulatory subunit 6 [Zancudomyces culisetae]|eukprot:OMH86362.1 26S proteasome non-ATPase regulatory subunit 6 [Zancudomyces culisetae]